MTTVARRVVSVPVRTASDSWRTICGLLAPSSGAARDTLDAIAGTCALLIADEQFREHPLIASGCGPQVRIYTLHGDDAVEAEGDSETSLGFDATAGDWQLSLPVRAEDLDWVRAALAGHERIQVRDGDANTPTRSSRPRRSSADPVIDLSQLRIS